MNSPAMNFVDCDSLPGKLADICRGTARKHDGVRYTAEERYLVMSRRLRQSVGNFELPNAPPDVLGRTTKPAKSGIGDRLHVIVERETGSPIECSQCREEVNRLNWMSAEEVQSEKLELAARMVRRAPQKAPKWWQRWGARLAPAFARKEVEKWIDEACGATAATPLPLVTLALPFVSAMPVSTIVTSIRTARREAPTLGSTIQSMISAGLQPPVVFGEPDVDDGLANVRWTEHKGAFRGFIDHVQWLLDHTDSETFLLCEDDVQFAPRLADRLREIRLGGEIVTLFKPHGLSLAGRGLQRVNAVNGSLAVLLRRETARRLVASQVAREWPKKDCVDRFLSRAAAEIGAPVLSPAQSWVQHTGRHSVCQPKRWALNSLTHRMRYASDFEADVPLTSPGLVTLITPTGDRQDAFRLCERWMTQQRYQGEIQWLVIDDGQRPTECTLGQQYIRRKHRGERHSLCANIRLALPEIRGQHVLIIEDDDYYGPDYISTMVGTLQRADLVGELGAKYYYLRHRKWRHRLTETWASFCRTGFNASVLDTLRQCVEGTNHPSIDLRLWQAWNGPRETWTDEAGVFRGCVGIKGVAGRQSRGWRPVADAAVDRDWEVLRKWVGDDWSVYQELAMKLAKR